MIDYSRCKAPSEFRFAEYYGLVKQRERINKLMEGWQHLQDVTLWV